MKEYFQAIERYFDIKGRSTRKEFWYFAIVNAIILLGLNFLDIIIFNRISDGGFHVLTGMYQCLILIPSFTLAVRRLHDSGRSGWWMLISFLPLLGVPILFLFYILSSEKGSNKWGDNPQEEKYEYDDFNKYLV